MKTTRLQTTARTCAWLCAASFPSFAQTNNPAPAAQDKPATAQAPSLGDLGFPTDQTKGSAPDQARLDRRSHMLRTHQKLGLITLALLIATLNASNGATRQRARGRGRRDGCRICGRYVVGIH